MQCKRLQILWLCAVIQFQYIVAVPPLHNGKPQNVQHAGTQQNINPDLGPNTSEHNINNEAQKNIESTVGQANEYETTVGGGQEDPTGDQGQPSSTAGGQTNSESGTNNSGNNRDGRQYENGHGTTPPQSTRHICTISTQHYDCQIQNVHLKTGTGQPSVFGLDHNRQRQLTFRDSTLEYLPKSLTDAFPYATLMNLNSLMIASIEQNAFQNAKNLETMYLEDNRLTNIDSSAFIGASRLHMLVLSRNYISFIDNSAFDTTPALKHLYLDQNQLNALPAFTNTANLQILNASHNIIASIDGRHFNNQRNLRTLDLSFNRLQRLNLQQLNAYLDLVDVSSNKLTEFIMPPYVTHLNARNNSLTEFKARQQCNLQTINLVRNKLKNQPWLETCSSLERLDLSHNSLEAFQYRSWMANIQLLNLAHNNLFEFQLPTKYPPLSLRVLDLSYNQLSYGPSLIAFKKLEGVLLNDNNFISLKHYADKTSNPNFKGYRMANNEWNCADVQNFEHLTRDKDKQLCTKEMETVHGICCIVYSKPYNDRLNQVLREADFHERSNKKKCRKPEPPGNNQKTNKLEEIRNAIANANSEKASKLKEIQDATTKAANFKTILKELQDQRNRINTSKSTLANEIEKQRQFHRVTKEGLILDREMLERIIKFVQEKDAFNKDLLSRREKETEASNNLFSDKQGETDERKQIISNLQRTLADFKQEEKAKKKEKDLLEKKVNKNAASIHGGTGRISQY